MTPNKSALRDEVELCVEDAVRTFLRGSTHRARTNLPHQSSAPMSNATPGDLLNELVETHWETAARHAWRQYEQRGPGAIVFPVEPDSTEERRPLRYLTFSDEDAAAEGAFAKLYELVQTYDPERQVVIAVELPDDRTVFDVYEQTPPPPDA